MDALSETLRLVRLTGAVFLNADLSAPWAVASPPSRALADVLLPEAEHLIEYHLVVDGRCYIRVSGEPPVELAAGDLVMLPHGDAHQMASDASFSAPMVDADVGSLARPGEITAPRIGGGGASTRLVCGYFAIDRRLCAGLIASLPRVLKVDAAGGDVAAWIATYVRIRLDAEANAQPGSACVLAKLSELMFVEAIRRYVDAQPAGRSGWLAALKDPAVSRALAALHGRPAHDWTVEALAREAGASRSVLAERFASLVGVSPMHYLTQWRLALAAHLLATTSRPASSVALEVGYASEAAFNRAFRRAHGAPPAAWRRDAHRGGSGAPAVAVPPALG